MEVIRRYRYCWAANATKERLHDSGIPALTVTDKYHTGSVWDWILRSSSIALMVREADADRAERCLNTLETELRETDDTDFDGGSPCPACGSLQDTEPDLILDKDRWIERYDWMHMIIRVLRGFLT